MALKNAAQGWVEMEGFMFTISLAIIYTILSLVLIVIGVNGKDKSKTNTYVKIKATITEKVDCKEGKCKSYNTRTGDCLRRDTGNCLYFFKYYVKGQEYNGQDTMKSTYQIGNKVSIEYNPDNPADYRNASLSSADSVVLIVLGAITGLIAIGFGGCATKEGCRSVLGVASVFSPSNTGTRITNGIGNLWTKFK